VICEAICHGGDIGGPYFSNKNDLEKAVKVLTETIGCGYRWMDTTNKCWIMLVEDENNE